MGISWTRSKDEQIHSLISIIKDTNTSQKKRDWCFSDLLNLLQPQIKSHLNRYCRRFDHDRCQAESHATQAIWDAVNYFDPEKGIFSHLIQNLIGWRLKTWLLDELRPDRAGFRTVSIDTNPAYGEDHQMDHQNCLADPASTEDQRQHDERDEFLKCWRELAPRLTTTERIAIIEVYANGKTYVEAAEALPKKQYQGKLSIPCKRIDNAIVRAKGKAKLLGFDFDKITAKKSS